MNGNTLKHCSFCTYLRTWTHAFFLNLFFMNATTLKHCSFFTHLRTWTHVFFINFMYSKNLCLKMKEGWSSTTIEWQYWYKKPFLYHKLIVYNHGHFLKRTLQIQSMQSRRTFTQTPSFPPCKEHNTLLWWLANVVRKHPWHHSGDQSKNKVNCI
jgi:hypothetical protein